MLLSNMTQNWMVDHQNMTISAPLNEEHLGMFLMRIFLTFTIS